MNEYWIGAIVDEKPRYKCPKCGELSDSLIPGNVCKACGSNVTEPHFHNVFYYDINEGWKTK